VKPILFNSEMVRALLEGRKCVTRRLIKPQPKNEIVQHCGVWQETHSGTNGLRVFPPPYSVGDILYVRENWSVDALPMGAADATIYMADYSEMELQILRERHFRWKPSVHMPRELARIFLRVTGAEIVRLQDITADQALAEGIPPCHDPIPAGNREAYYRACFGALWDTTMKPEDKRKYGWDANPWVWAIHFERCEKTEVAECSR